MGDVYYRGVRIWWDINISPLAAHIILALQSTVMAPHDAAIGAALERQRMKPMMDRFKAAADEHFRRYPIDAQILEALNVTPNL